MRKHFHINFIYVYYFCVENLNRIIYKEIKYVNFVLNPNIRTFEV